MLFERIESEGLAHYSYLIGDKSEAVVIDPRRDGDVYVDLAERAGYHITHVLETHRNEDYVVGSVELAARTGAAIWHADDQWGYRYGRAVEDGQTWAVGGLRLRAIHAPGHTPGMMNYLLHDPGGAPWMLFSGDTLFAGEVGRVDLMGEERIEEMAGMLYDTLHGSLLPLGDGIIVCPAHGAGSVCGAAIADRPWTTIGLERQHNPALRAPDRRTFITRQAQPQERPPYFARMERLNVEGPPPISPLPVPTPLTPEAFAREAEDALVLDTRTELAFNAGHVPGAMSIWRQGLGSFAGWFLPHDRPILLVTEEEDPMPAVRVLLRMGFDNVAGHLAGGMHAWHMAGRDSASIRMVTVPDLCRWLDEGNRPAILDVRGDAELEQGGTISGAQHIHITEIPQRLDEVPDRRPVHIFCGSGLRSTIAASLLEREGRHDLTVVLGGATGWNSVSCPLEIVQRA